MAIRFRCKCGEEIVVPDGMEGTETLCPACSGTVRAPAGGGGKAGSGGAAGAGPEGAGEGESVSALFRAAIEAFGESAEGSPTAAPGEDESAPEPDVALASEAPTRPYARRDAGRPAEKPQGPKDAAAAPAPPEAAAAEPLVTEEKGFPAGDAEKAAAPEAPAKHAPPAAQPAPAPAKSPGAPAAGGPKSKDALSPQDALAAIEMRAFKKAIRREGEPEGPMAPYEPEEYEVTGDRMKFRCRCGKKISAPLESKRSIGRCPRCGSRLVLPNPKAAARKAEAPAEEGDEKSARIRQAVAQAADRMRTGGQRPRRKRAKAPSTPAPAWIARFVAFQLDAALVAGVFFVAAFAGATAGSGAMWITAAVFAALGWAGNRVALTAAAGASVGMMLVGLRLGRTGGGRPGLALVIVRAAAGLALLPLAPLALADPGRRTLADRVSGSVVVQAGQAAQGAQGAQGAQAAK